MVHSEEVNPYESPQHDTHVPPAKPPVDPNAREPLEVWLKCWLGIGLAGIVQGLNWGAFGLSRFVPLAFGFGLLTTTLVFPIAVQICGSPLSRRAARRTCVLCGVIAATCCATFLTRGIGLLPTLLFAGFFAIFYVPGAVLFEVLHWERVDHNKVRKMVDRFRGMPH